LPRRNDFAYANLVKVSRVLHCTHPPSRLPIAVGSGEQNDSQHVCRPFGRPLRAQVKAGTARGCPVRVRPNVKLRSAPTHRRLLLEIPAKFFLSVSHRGFFSHRMRGGVRVTPRCTVQQPCDRAIKEHSRRGLLALWCFVRPQCQTPWPPSFSTTSYPYPNP
jgi:hypothetical protein